VTAGIWPATSSSPADCKAENPSLRNKLRTGPPNGQPMAQFETPVAAFLSDPIFEVESSVECFISPGIGPNSLSCSFTRKRLVD